MTSNTFSLISIDQGHEQNNATMKGDGGTRSNSTSKPSTDVSVIDGPVLVNILKPTSCKTFGDYATNVFVPYLGQQQQHANRMDMGPIL